MSKRFGLAVMYLLLLIGTFELHTRLCDAWEETVYTIKSDGSVEKSGIGTSPELRLTTEDNITYTLTEDVYAIIIERSNIILDINGHLFQHNDYYGWGILLSCVTNVTVKNIGGFTYFEDGSIGILLASSSNNTICHNQIVPSNCLGLFIGIEFRNSSFNVIYGNNIYATVFDFWILTGGCINYWDDGYPSGGNYWGIYPIGSDVYRGPYQNVTGGDGIVDRPRIIDADNVDRYPLMRPIEMPRPAYTVASFDYAPDSPIALQTGVVFNAYDSMGVNCTITSYGWDFGDGTGGSGVNITHIYETHGAYNVTLTVSTPYHLSSTQVKMTVLRDFPIASFTYSPSSNLAVAQDITFNASSSEPRGGEILNHTWDFGDANTTSTVNPMVVHSYPAPGTYNVTLVVIDSEGLDSSYSLLVLVRMPTYVSISTSSSSTYVGVTVEINGTLHDFYGNGLEDETVVLAYTFTGIDTWTPITSDTVDSHGHYRASWIPPSTGSFTIKVEWNGNATHFRANKTIILTVTKGSVSFIDTPLGKTVVYGIPITVMVVLVLVYILRRR